MKRFQELYLISFVFWGIESPIINNDCQHTSDLSFTAVVFNGPAATQTVLVIEREESYLDTVAEIPHSLS